MSTRGVVYVHSSAPALTPHVEWALAGVLGVPVTLDWVTQPVAPGSLRAELTWAGRAGTAALLASALRRCTGVRYEVVEEPSSGSDGARFCSTPALGMFCAVTDAAGQVLVPEARLAAAVASAEAADADLAALVRRLLGQPWDDELEPFRRAGDGAPVRLLHRVG